jgi:UrcA family protein
MKKIALILTMVPMVTALAPVASATDRDYASYNRSESPPQETVQFRDLNLTSEAGIKALYTRISSAASGVCGERNTSSERDLARAALIAQCRADSIRKAVASIGNAKLSQYWLAHGAYKDRPPVAVAKSAP